MADYFWPLCKFTLVTTFLWMTLAFLALMEESRGENHCAIHINQYEKHHRIPDGLLHAISKVESGRKDRTGRIVAWPWTINAEGQGYYFPTKEEAIEAVEALQKKGIKSVDVGCMQVNLYHHPDAFKHLKEAFDPAKNVAYAARFLAGLKNEHSSWHKAVAHYHSANPLHHIPYRKSVMGAWKREKGSGEIHLAAGFFEEETPRKVNRLHRFKGAKTLSLTHRHLMHASSKGVVRRITNSNSPRLQRFNSKSTRRTLKVS